MKLKINKLLCFGFSLARSFACSFACLRSSAAAAAAAAITFIYTI